MTTTLLDALPDVPVRTAIREALGDVHAVHTFCEERFAPCTGCYECWLKTPGKCGLQDAANPVMADAIAADTVIWTTRVRFGSWDPIAKAALDRSIGLVSPFFTTVDGETHRQKRYAHYPRWKVVAVTDDQTTEADRERFRTLVARNALNLHSEEAVVAFVDEGASADDVREALARAVPAPSNKAPPAPDLERVGVAPTPGRPRHAVCWVGSGKPPGTSTSEKMARPLLERLEHRGWTTEIIHTRAVAELRATEAPALVSAFERADLLIVSSPVYVDCLPASVLTGMRLVGHTRISHPPVLLPIIQCGFPEADHTTLALQILADFAQRNGMGWAGHLAVGGSGAFEDTQLTVPSGRGARQARALLDAAAALDVGNPIPHPVTEAFATPLQSPAMYRTSEQLGWLAQAWTHGAMFHLNDRPFPEASD